MLHTYLSDGQLRKTAEKESEMDDILSTTIHVGNSDIVSEFVYDNSEDLVDIIATIKQIQSIYTYKTEPLLSAEIKDLVELFERHDQVFIVKDDDVYKLHITKENVHKLFLN